MIAWWRLQNSWLTGWLWQFWQHDETGRVVLLPLWTRPGPRWHRFKKPSREDKGNT